MFTTERHCSPEERQYYWDYQTKIAQEAKSGRPVMTNMAVPFYMRRPGALRMADGTARQLGGLRSFFERLGDTRTDRPEGRFLISDIADQIASGTCPDQRMTSKVVAYMALCRGLGSRPMITLARARGPEFIVDGNHSAMAAYLVALEDGDVAVSVYVLHATTGPFGVG